MAQRKPFGFLQGGVIPAIALAATVAALCWGAGPVFGQGQGWAVSEEKIALALARLRAGGATPGGKAIYRAACATCHGTTGDGKGPDAAGFAQPATDFRSGFYKFRSTAYESPPTDADLERSIREGMPGTEMVPFGRLLSLPDRLLVARTLKTFSTVFFEDGEPVEPEPLEMPAARPAAASAKTIAAGREAYTENDCGDCHGDKGEGSKDEKDELERPVKMIPFSAGYFKSGRADVDLYRTIATGMNGTTMEGYADEMSEDEIWATVDFMRSLADSPGWIDYLFAAEPSGLAYPAH